MKTRGKPFDITDYQDTAFCPIHLMLEPFKVLNEPKISLDSRASLAAHGGKLVTVSFVCGQGKQQIVTAA